MVAVGENLFEGGNVGFVGGEGDEAGVGGGGG